MSRAPRRLPPPDELVGLAPSASDGDCDGGGPRRGGSSAVPLGSAGASSSVRWASQSSDCRQNLPSSAVSARSVSVHRMAPARPNASLSTRCAVNWTEWSSRSEKRLEVLSVRDLIESYRSAPSATQKKRRGQRYPGSASEDEPTRFDIQP